MAINPGTYIGRPIKGGVEIGESNKGTLQLNIKMDVLDSENKPLGQMETPLYFSTSAWPMTAERLRLLGWKGNGPEDLSEASVALCVNDVPVQVTAPEKFQDPKTGEWKQGVSKLEILTGSGVRIAKKLDWATFQARARVLVSGDGGGNASSSTSTPNSGGVEPPF